MWQMSEAGIWRVSDFNKTKTIEISGTNTLWIGLVCEAWTDIEPCGVNGVQYQLLSVSRALFHFLGWTV